MDFQWYFPMTFLVCSILPRQVGGVALRRAGDPLNTLGYPVVHERVLPMLFFVYVCIHTCVYIYLSLYLSLSLSLYIYIYIMCMWFDLLCYVYFVESTWVVVQHIYRERWGTPWCMRGSSCAHVRAPEQAREDASPEKT